MRIPTHPTALAALPRTANRAIPAALVGTTGALRYTTALCCCLAIADAAWSAPAPAVETARIETITQVVLRSNRAGTGTTWFHPRCCLVANGQGREVLMNMQPIGGSDYFGTVHWSSSTMSPELGFDVVQPMRALPARNNGTIQCLERRSIP